MPISKGQMCPKLNATWVDNSRWSSCHELAKNLYKTLSNLALEIPCLFCLFSHCGWLGEGVNTPFLAWALSSFLPGMTSLIRSQTMVNRVLGLDSFVHHHLFLSGWLVWRGSQCQVWAHIGKGPLGCSSSPSPDHVRIWYLNALKHSSLCSSLLRGLVLKLKIQVGFVWKHVKPVLQLVSI